MLTYRLWLGARQAAGKLDGTKTLRRVNSVDEFLMIFDRFLCFVCFDEGLQKNVLLFAVFFSARSIDVALFTLTDLKQIFLRF